jgi:hypothetical protein
MIAAEFQEQIRGSSTRRKEGKKQIPRPPCSVGMTGVGLSLSLLTAMCLVGTVWGIHLRTGARVSCFFSTCSTDRSSNRLGLDLPADETAPDRLAQLIEVRNEIERLDIKDAEKQRLFKAVVSNLDKLGTTETSLRGWLNPESSPARSDFMRFGLAFEGRKDLFKNVD